MRDKSKESSREGGGSMHSAVPFKCLRRTPHGLERVHEGVDDGVDKRK
jgi:hypothetical protein